MRFKKTSQVSSVHRSENLVFIVPNEDPRLGAVAFKFLTEDRRVLESEDAATMAK